MTCAWILAAISPLPACLQFSTRRRRSPSPDRLRPSLRFRFAGAVPVGNGNLACRRHAALLGARVDRYTGEARFLQLTADQRGVVMTMRRARQKTRRVLRKDFRERVRHVVGEHVVLDPVPDAEQITSAGLEHPPRLAVDRLLVGKKHGTELAAHEIEGCIAERQSQRIGLPPADAVVGGLLWSRIVEHRLVEVGDDICGVLRKPGRQRARHHAAAGRDSEDCARRQGIGALRHGLRIALEDQRHHMAVVVFGDRSGERLVGFGHRLSPRRSQRVSRD